MTEFRNTCPADRPALTSLWQEAFGDDAAFIDTFFETGYAPERSLAAVIDGSIAGMLYWFDCALGREKLAYIYAVATKPALQGRGVATGLMEGAHAILARQGCSGAVLSPGSESLFRFYGRMGYVTAGFCREERVLPGKAIPIREVEPEEYAQIRRELLPETGIRQEGANLAFLHRLVRFYAGEGFCAAVSREGAYAPEFLGDPEKCPGLLGALGMPEASVRMPGQDKECAMVKWFSGFGPEEFYLGFPFD